MITGHIQARHWPQFRQVFMCRHINRQWQQQAAVWTDGGTKLWPVVHRLRHYWAISVWGGVMSCHLTLGCFDKMLHLSWSVLKTPCAHNITFSYSCFLELSPVSVTLWLSLCVCVCASLKIILSLSYWVLTGYLSCMITSIWHFFIKHDRILS